MGDTLELNRNVRVDVHRTRAEAQAIQSRISGHNDLSVVEQFAEDVLPQWDEEWLSLERERFRQMRLHTLDMVAENLIAQGRLQEALDVAMLSIDGDPLRESAHRIAINAHIAEGNRAAAMRQYEELRVLLLDELNVSPSFGIHRNGH